jgi:peptidoglycan-associated lipoprotein
MLVLSGCHKKHPAPPPPPPPPPPPAAPAASISVSPLAIHPGESATLTWSTKNATQITISGLGTVAATGSRTVSPTASETYSLVAKGPGGIDEEAARLTVNPLPSKPTPPPTISDEQLFERNIKDVFFDYDKFALRTPDAAVAEEDASFLTKHPGMKIVIEGHCDERGSAEYNIALGQSRAESLEKALVNDGVPSARIKVISVGKEKPFCTESNEQCWQQNRRDHLKLDR